MQGFIISKYEVVIAGIDKAILSSIGLCLTSIFWIQTFGTDIVILYRLDKLRVLPQALDTRVIANFNDNKQ